MKQKRGLLRPLFWCEEIGKDLEFCYNLIEFINH